MRRPRSAAVAVAVTLQQLLAGKTSGWTEDQALVLEALRRANPGLAGASEAELGAYLRWMGPEQLQGLASNVKGILHEMLFVRAQNLDGDAISARLFERANHPGADVEFTLDGEVVREVQLKAMQIPAGILEHFDRYPDIDVVATSEVFAAFGPAYAARVADSGVSNAEITGLTKEVLDDLAHAGLLDLVENGAAASLLAVGAVQARAALDGRTVDGTQVRSALELAGIGAAAALAMEALLNLV